MPIQPKAETTIPGKRGNYLIKRIITEGNMAWALEAENLDQENRKVFLKYYKSPTPTVSWYRDYLRYVSEINRRLEESSAHQYCVLCRDLFTANPRPGLNPHEYMFQAFDFIESGKDLRVWLDSGINDWNIRVDVAKIFLVAMKKIHEAGVVHCDLKPENVQLLETTSSMGLIPRMIDMDRSILQDVEAPWVQGEHKEGYVGTPGYFSPEHLRGETPVCASDVFTIGIILCEILCGCHPFAAQLDDRENYKAAVLEGGCYGDICMLSATLGGSAEHAAQFTALIERCLSPVAESRPTVAELHAALLDMADEPADSPVAEVPVPVEEIPAAEGPETAPEPKPEANPARVASTLVLKGNNGEFRTKIGMDLGSKSLPIATIEANFAARDQFRVEKRADGWYALPCVGTKNMTMLNGTELTEATRLSENDTLCLQGRSSGKQAMQLTVSLI